MFTRYDFFSINTSPLPQSSHVPSYQIVHGVVIIYSLYCFSVLFLFSIVTLLYCRRTTRGRWPCTKADALPLLCLPYTGNFFLLLWFLWFGESWIYLKTWCGKHRIRAQKDTVLPDGVPNHIYSFPEQYGLEKCGNLKHVLKQLVVF